MGPLHGISAVEFAGIGPGTDMRDAVLASRHGTETALAEWGIAPARIARLREVSVIGRRSEP